MPAALLRVLRPEDIKCPAGEAKGDAGCLCRIEQEYIDGHLNPSTLESFCLVDPSGNPELGYMGCPTWRADKETYWASGENLADLLDAA